MSAVKGSFDKGWLASRKTELTDADDLADAPTRQYVAAEQAVAEVCRLIIDAIVQIWDTGGANKIQALRTHAEADFVSAEIQALERVHGDVQGFITARAWHKAVLAGKQVSWGISPIKKIADRRQSYSAERVKALQAIDDIKGVNALFAQVGALRQRVEVADRLAERKVARFEDGIATLKEVVSTATTLKRVAKDAASCKDQLAQARERLDKLEVNITTAHIEPQLAQIRTQLGQAEESYNSESYEEALKLLAIVSSDLDGAEGLSGALGGAVEAQQRAHGASEGFEVLKCIDELKALAEQAQKEPHADLASHELTHVFASLDEARSQLAQGQVRIALIPLQGASDLLVTARTVLTEHARFLKLREALQGRVDNLRKAKAAKGNKPNIDRVAELLALADKADGQRDWIAATAALRMGALDADIAEIASQARETWEARAAELLKRKKGFNAGPERTAVEQALTDSEAAADQLDFTRATTLLDTAESRMDALRVADLAGRAPARKEIVTRVRAMMRTEAGPALVDALVQNLPMETPVALFTALARERFGIELTLDEDTKKWEAPTAKKLWEMLAKVPEGHARNNPSLKVVRREEPDEDGGFYRGSEDLVVMNGRPSNNEQQSFGSRLRSDGMPCFPDPVEESCLPVNEDDVNYFDFATLHEVGHAVDDRLGFMDSRQRQDAFGGWISHGSDLGPIADAVAQAKGYDPEYVLNLMLKKKDPVEPPPPEGRDPVGWNASRDAVKAWYALATMEDAYRRQPLAEQSAIGDRVYQQAYSDTWVSYKLDARKRGLTGYQFRAPGEWFAELYAGYHSGKIKNGHPSAAWLKTL